MSTSESEAVKTGRPSEYKPEYAELVVNLVIAGQAVTDAELAEIFDVSPTTIRNWSAQHREFLLARKRQKALKIAKLTGRFMDRAMGMTIREQHVTKDGAVIDTMRELPPDTSAAIFALKNLAGWRDVTETINVNATLNLVEYAREYARRIGPEAAKRFLLDHGYPAERLPELIELEPESVSTRDP